MCNITSFDSKTCLCSIILHTWSRKIVDYINKGKDKTQDASNSTKNGIR